MDSLEERVYVLENFVAAMAKRLKIPPCPSCGGEKTIRHMICYTCNGIGYDPEGEENDST